MLAAIGKAIPILLVAIASGSAMAEWIEVGSSAIDTLYVDPAIRWSDNNTAKMWALNNFKATQRREERQPFKSEKVENEYDCKGQRSRMLYFTSHADAMAEGEVVDFNVVPSEWAPVPPNSGLEELWKIACGKA